MRRTIAIVAAVLVLGSLGACTGLDSPPPGPPLGHEGVPMHKTVVSSTKPVTVSCVVTVRTGGADA